MCSHPNDKVNVLICNVARRKAWKETVRENEWFGAPAPSEPSRCPLSETAQSGR